MLGLVMAVEGEHYDFLGHKLCCGQWGGLQTCMSHGLMRHLEDMNNNYLDQDLGMVEVEYVRRKVVEEEEPGNRVSHAKRKQVAFRKSSVPIPVDNRM
jgi:hypothetical protein